MSCSYDGLPGLQWQRRAGSTERGGGSGVPRGGMAAGRHEGGDGASARADHAALRVPVRVRRAHALVRAGAERERLAAARDPMLARLRDRLAAMATSRGRVGKLPTGVRWWIKYCVHGRGISPVRTVDESSPRDEKLKEETLLMDFFVWLVACRPSGRSISVETAQKYIYEVQAWASRLPYGGGRIGGGLEMARLRGLARGMAAACGEAEKRPRYGVRTQQLAEAMAAQLAGGSADEANWRAALATGFCALMRGAELGAADGETWSEELHVTRADLTFFRDEGGVLHAVIMMRPLKKGPGTRKTTPVFLRAGGSLLDPVMELWEMVRRDPVPEAARASTPLFRDTRSGRAFRTSDVCAVVRWLMQSIGERPERFGAHSLRIGGASAALAAGVEPSMIRLLGRWASDVAELYMRVSRQASSRLSAVVGSTRYEDVERHAFHSEELEVLPSEWRHMALELDLDAGMES